MPRCSDNILSRFASRYFDPELELHVQAFKILACNGIAATVVTATLTTVLDLGALHIAANFSIPVLMSLLLCFAHSTKRYQLCCRISIFAVFFVILPVLFFTGGGYHSGMLCFFVLAFVFTALMLPDKRERIIALVLEFLLYNVICVVAYARPDTVTFLATETIFMIEAIAGMSISGALLLSIITLYIGIYERKQKQLEELDKLKTEFYCNMHHEIRTPLTVISTDIQNADDMLDFDFDFDKADIQSKLRSAQHISPLHQPSLCSNPYKSPCLSV